MHNTSILERPGTERRVAGKVESGRQRSIRFLVAAAILVAGTWVLNWLTGPPVIIENESQTAGVLAPAFIEPGELDRLIAAYETRIADHTDALDYRTLGGLYLEKGRVTSDISRYVAAKEAFERAVDLFPSDPSSRIGLAASHYSLHDFESAREQAALVHEGTDRLDALALLTDASYALGDYDAANGYLAELAVGAGDAPPVLVRRAEAGRRAGDLDAALTLAEEAARATSESPNARLRAWYAAFVADMSLRLGRYEEGLDWAEEAVASDPTAITGRLATARLAAATGEMDRAITVYEALAGSQPDPVYLAELGDLYLLQERPAAAEDRFATVEVAATLAESRGVHDRAFALFLADHEREPERAVEIARREMTARQDAAAYDTLAWALYRSGKYEEAATAATQALAMGTLDARFSYHAGMIASALGDTDEARRYLTDALHLSPEFQPLQAEKARAELERLGG